ncbi:RNA polymerase sigma factor [Rudaea sp.]|uniref:RNA polymerase sigma factor n=1 Tax=Rudaea sp. TaxID=2136325 RepID=UPI002ED69A0B
MNAFDHLFRHESGRMVAALTRIFGAHNLALAEDVAQDALCRALEVWKIQGTPDNPGAWLMATAKHRALDLLRHAKRVQDLAPEIARAIQDDRGAESTVDELFGAAAIQDDQLRLMFSCCNPRLAEEVRVALVLHILCGFSTAEIAAAFLSHEEAIKKRILRGKKLLASSRRLFELTRRDSSERLSSVHRALYLLFNEGYHGASAEFAVRKELCDEAIRLGALLCENESTAVPATHALLALMCLHAARLPARIDSAGDFTMLLDQDRSRWDARLIADGQRLMDLSAKGKTLSPYHVEAAIASIHAAASSSNETPWESIVALYDALMQIRPSPVVGLNRALAIAQRDGPRRGLAEIECIADRDRLAEYPFYSAALGELHLRLGDLGAARAHFTDAMRLARNATERRLLQRRIAECGSTAFAAVNGIANRLRA